MKVTIRNIDDSQNEQVIIECVEVTPEIEDIRSYALMKGTDLYGTSESGGLERIPLSRIYYFEAVDEKVFAYTKGRVYEIKRRLYEIEKAYENHHFIRCSKSVVLNLMLLGGISPSLNGRYTANMKNGEKLIISRKYAAIIKDYITKGAKGV